MKEIQISIIIPNFNKGNFIGQTINSILNQDFVDWETIIIDDGSTDNSIEIIQNYCNRDNRIKLIYRKELPRGGSACRNKGIQNAMGKYILFLDSDDLLAPSCLKKRLKKITETQYNKFWVFPIETFYNTPGDHPKKWIPYGKNHLKKILSHKLPWHTMSPLWDRNFLNELKGFDNEYPRLQDIELHTRALIFSNGEYECFSNLTPDAYYRISQERNQTPIEKQLCNYIDSVFLYIKKTETLLPSKKYTKYLRGTLFILQTNINYTTTVQENRPNFRELASKEIERFISKNKLFKRKNFFLLKLYNYLYLKGLWKVKGFNYCMKICFIYC